MCGKFVQNKKFWLKSLKYKKKVYFKLNTTKALKKSCSFSLNERNIHQTIRIYTYACTLISKINFVEKYSFKFLFIYSLLFNLLRAF